MYTQMVDLHIVYTDVLNDTKQETIVVIASGENNHHQFYAYLFTVTASMEDHHAPHCSQIRWDIYCTAGNFGKVFN